MNTLKEQFAGFLVFVGLSITIISSVLGNILVAILSACCFLIGLFLFNEVDEENIDVQNQKRSLLLIKKSFDEKMEVTSKKSLATLSPPSDIKSKKDYNEGYYDGVVIKKLTRVVQERMKTDNPYDYTIVVRKKEFRKWKTQHFYG